MQAIDLKCSPRSMVSREDTAAPEIHLRLHDKVRALAVLAKYVVPAVPRQTSPENGKCSFQNFDRLQEILAMLLKSGGAQSSDQMPSSIFIPT